MKQKQLLLVLLSLQVITLTPIDDHFVSTTGDVVVQSKDNDVNILADTNGSTGKINLQAGTTTPSTTTAGDIGLSAANELVIKAATRLMFDAPITESVVGDKAYTSAITTSTEFPGGTVSGNLIVHNDITFDANLTITGNLIVHGGSVTINSGVDVTVTGDTIFNGNDENKQVSIVGDIVSGSDHGVQRFIIKNYNPITGVPVSISGTVIANHEVLITNNQATAAATNGVAVSGAISAYESIVFSHNNGITTGHGVSVMGVIESFTHDVVLIDNSSSGNGNGVLCSGVGKSITALQQVLFVSNSSAGTGRGVTIESSFAVTSSDNIYFKGNTSTSGAKVNLNASTLTAPEVIFDENTIILSTGLIKTSATINGTVVVNGSLTVSATTTFDDDLIVRKGPVAIGAVTLTVNGNILFDGLGSSVDTYVEMTSSSGVINGNNITIKNFIVDSTLSKGAVLIRGTVNATGDLEIDNCQGRNAISVEFFSTSTVAVDGDISITNITTNVNGIAVYLLGTITADNILIDRCTAAGANSSVQACGTITAQGDITISNNTTASTGNASVFICTNTTMQALTGTILFSKNQSGDAGVNIFTTPVLVEAQNIVFADNISTGNNDAVSNTGVLVRTSNSLVAHNAMIFERNKAGAGGTAYGVSFNTAFESSYNQICKDLIMIYNNSANNTNVKNIGSLAFTQYYGGGALGAGNKFEKSNETF